MAAAGACLALAPPAGAGADGDALTVYPGTLLPQTAVTLAIARHPEIRGAEAVMARRQADVALAESARWPTLLYGLGPGYGGSYGGGGNQAAVRGSLGVTVPVWDFGATDSRIKGAKSLQAASQQGRADAVERVGAATFAAYLDAVAAQERLAGAQQAIAAMRGVAGRIDQRVQAGLSNRSDVNAASIAVMRVEVEAEQARTAADAAMSQLIQLIGVSPAGVASLAESYALVAGRDRGGTPDFDAAPAIQAARRALEAADARLETARADRYPAIGVSASRSFSTGRYSANDSTWIGLALSGNFSLGGADRERVRGAAADRAAAEQDLAARRLQVHTEWLVAERQEEGARRRLDDMEDVSRLWLSTRDLYWQEYILDRRSLSDVINAEREIRNAQSERITAMGEAANAAMRALLAQGGLVALLERQPQRPAAAASGPVAAPAALAASAASAASASPATDRWIELGVFPRDEQARAAWAEVRAQASARGLQPRFARAGASTRLLIGPLATRAAAHATCAALNPAGRACPMVLPADAAEGGSP